MQHVPIIYYIIFPEYIGLQKDLVKLEESERLKQIHNA